jgi:type I restriction enzyme S subunit
MSKEWPRVKLGEVLRRVERFEPRDELTEYPFAGTYSFARGIFVGERKLGSAFALPKIQRIRAGDFIYCKIMAWEGAFGIAPKEADNCVMSGAFVIYELNRDKIDEKFLDYFFKVPDHWQSIGSQSSGTNVRRQSLHPTQFERAEIPLPSLEEQRRMVSRIEELAAQVLEARTLRHQAAEEAEALILSALTHLRLPAGTKSKPIAECSRMSTGTTPPSERSDFYGGPVQWYTPGDLEYQMRLGTSSRTLTELALAERKARMFEPGTVLLVAIGGSLGKVALTHERCSANQQITGIKFSEEVLPEYGFWWVRGLGKALMAAAPQATLPIINQERIGEFEISVPPLAEQRRIVAELDALQAEVDALKRLQAETAAELDALLPALLDRAFKGEL